MPQTRSSCRVATNAAASSVGQVAAPAARSTQLKYGDRYITLETGEIGRQASGAVMVTDGETMIYTTVCADADNASDGSFAPLQVNYTERFSAAGRTSGGFVKRDSRPKEHEVLVSRLVDRPLRPAVADGWPHSTQVLQWVMSYDSVHAPEPLAITAAGAAMALSEVPMKRAVAGVRVGLIPGRGFVVNPTVPEMEESRLDLVMAGTSEAVLMIEGFCDFLTEADMLEAIALGQATIAEMCRGIEAFAAEVGAPKRVDEVLTPPAGLDDAVRAMIGADLENAYRTTSGKKERGEIVGELKSRVKAALVGEPGDDGTTPEEQKYDGTNVSLALKRVESGVMRSLVLNEGYRADGRGVNEVRPIWSRAGVLPRTHGSVLFTRGETQALAVTTLGCKDSAQRVDSMAGSDEENRRFYLQYFFPPSSVGETGRVGPPGRREVGHGNLAERALAPVVPSESEFPYTIRVESTITESNGSSSMASVCGGCLAMLDAGVPLRRTIAGVAMGLVLEPDGRFVVLTDILGSEDALGDMDFKVAGDDTGITAFQMDIKVEGITLPIMESALQAAGAGRRHILGEMAKCSPPPRGGLSQFAPRIRTLMIPVEKIGAVIGSGGRTARAIQEVTGVEIQIEQTGEVFLKGPSDEALVAAEESVRALAFDPEVGRVYRCARVVQVAPFGAFVEVAPKRDGLLHVSEWDVSRTASIADVVKEGDLVDVMVLEVAEGSGKIKLSRKAVLFLDGKATPPESSASASDYEVEPSTPPGRNGGGGRGRRPQLKISISDGRDRK